MGGEGGRVFLQVELRGSRARLSWLYDWAVQGIMCDVAERVARLFADVIFYLRQ